MIKRKFASFLLKILGWRIVGRIPEGEKCVVMMAPHTANIDFFYGWLGYASLGYKSWFLIKKEAFNWFTSRFLRAMGGIPVDRGRSSNIVLQLTEVFQKEERLILTITPEGTRKLNRNWKRGFYFIAENSNVPIVMGFLNYKTREGGFGPSFMPSGDYEKDFRKIRQFYKDKQPRHPEKFALPPENQEHLSMSYVNMIKSG